MHYLLIYEVGQDFVARRGQFRDEHLTLAWEAVERGELVVGGALADPVDSAMLLFETSDPLTVEAFARADPYVLHGLVDRWSIRTWRTVVGHEATDPIRPG